MPQERHEGGEALAAVGLDVEARVVEEAGPLPEAGATRGEPTEIDFAAQEKATQERLAAMRRELGLDDAPSPEEDAPPEDGDQPPPEGDAPKG